MSGNEQTPLSPVLAAVLEGLGDKVLAWHSQHGDDTILIQPAERRAVASFLSETADLAFDMLMDSTAVDYEGEEPRFEVVDHFFSTSKHHRLRVKCRVTEKKPSLPSLCPLYGAANWLERETFDMYGVVFEDHPDMRRILLYPEFVGYPLRKDYDKLHEQPLFTERYAGVRETDEKLHPRVGVELPIHGTEIPR
jgi:NADH-quinone oxidoreductase subunit C